MGKVGTHREQPKTGAKKSESRAANTPTMWWCSIADMREPSLGSENAHKLARTSSRIALKREHCACGDELEQSKEDSFFQTSSKSMILFVESAEKRNQHWFYFAHTRSRTTLEYWCPRGRHSTKALVRPRRYPRTSSHEDMTRTRTLIRTTSRILTLTRTTLVQEPSRGQRWSSPGRHSHIHSSSRG